MIEWSVTEKGIQLSCTEDDVQDLLEIKNEKGYYDAEAHALEDFLCNGGDYVAAEDIGALTDATIVSYDCKYYSDIAYYQLYSFVDLLIMEKQATIFKI